MTPPRILFLSAMAMALACALSATPSEGYFFTIDGNDISASTESEEKTSLREANRLLGSRRIMTCDRYPGVCRVVSSRGPDCCHKKCVNLSRDRNNCGECGMKCEYLQICCKGKCVNPMADKNNCGRCGNKCQKGDSDYCQHGICSYAYAS